MSEPREIRNQKTKAKKERSNVGIRFTVWQKENLRALVEGFYDAQEVRIRLGNRLRQVNDASMKAWGVVESVRDELKVRAKLPVTLEVTAAIAKEFPALVVESRVAIEILVPDASIRDSIHALLMESNEPLRCEEAAERQFLKLILRRIEDHPLYQRWESQRGIGPISIGGMLAWLDPEKGPKPSSFWRYGGFHIVCSTCGEPLGSCLHHAPGMAPKRERGKKITWNPKVRVHYWKVARSLKMAGNDFYCGFYDTFKAEEQADNPPTPRPADECDGYALANDLTIGKVTLKAGETIKKKATEGEFTKEWNLIQTYGQPIMTVMSKGQIHNRALRRMIKIWVAHIHQTWREELGLPARAPYIIGRDGHCTFIAPPV